MAGNKGEPEDNSLYIKAVVQGFFSLVIIAVFIFFLAGRLDYWQGWVFTGVCTACVLLSALLFAGKTDLVRERTRPGPEPEGRAGGTAVRASPDRPWSTLAMFGNNRRWELLANYILIYEAVLLRVFFALGELGLLKYTMPSEGDLLYNRRHPGINTITITRFGRRVMHYLARKAIREANSKSMVEWMQKELSFI